MVPNLEQKLLEELKALKKIIEASDDAKYLDAIKNREIEKYTSFYSSKEIIESAFQENKISNHFDGSYDVVFLPIENYNLLLQGNNRIVELRMDGNDMYFGVFLLKVNIRTIIQTLKDHSISASIYPNALTS